MQDFSLSNSIEGENVMLTENESSYFSLINDSSAGVNSYLLEKIINSSPQILSTMRSELKLQLLYMPEVERRELLRTLEEKELCRQQVKRIGLQILDKNYVH